MQAGAGVNIDLILVVQALIVMFIAAPILVRSVVPWLFSKAKNGHQG
jgi:simple sugar transport system permease protein